MRRNQKQFQSAVNLPPIEKAKVSEQMAKKVGVSEKTYRDARLIVNEGTPEQVRRMDEGRLQ